MSASLALSGYCETPVSTPDCGEPVALSVNVMAPVRFGVAPVLAFVNLTCTVEFAPGAQKALVQPSVPLVKAQALGGKMLIPAPETATPVIVTDGPPAADVLVKTTLPVLLRTPVP